MKVGHFNQRASWFTVGFVFGCIFIIIILLYIKVKAEQKADDFSYSNNNDYRAYLND